MERLWRQFSIDTRALALLRIAYGGIIVADLLRRAPTMNFWMGPDGMLPVEVARAPLSVVVSLHLLTDAMWFQWTLFALALLAGISLMLGFWSRTSAMLSWYFLISLQLRNLYMIDAGDYVLAATAFWLMFLPCGAAWSLDRRSLIARGERPPAAVVSVGSAGLLIQIAATIFVSSLWKLQGTTWPDGTAVGMALSDDTWARPFGLWLLGYPRLTALITWATLAVEFAGPLLLLLSAPRWQLYIRPPVLLGLFGFFVGIGTGLNLGLIPFVMTASLLPFLPAALLDKLFGTQAGGLVEDSDVRQLSYLGRLVQRSVPAIALALMLLLNVDQFLPKPFFQGAAGRVLESMRLTQGWNMYAPDPRVANARFVFVAATSDGRLHNFALGAERPGWPTMPTEPPLETIWNDYRLKMYMQDNITIPSPKRRALENLGIWYCKHSPTRPVRVQIRKIARQTRLAEPDAEIRSVIRTTTPLPFIDCPGRAASDSASPAG